nr:arsenate reductase family protein [uncultured Sphaerochaeta sp.]
MTIICYPACSTCKKAINFLNARSIEYTYRDIKQDRPDKEELREFLKRSNLPLKRFFNTSGQLYRSLNLKNRIQEMGEEEMLDLLSSDGMLVKRPLLVFDQFVLVGFQEKEWEAHLS